MKNILKKEWVVDLFIEIIGCFLISVATYNIALFSEFPMTGFSGIAIILYRIFGMPMGITTIVLNIPVAVLCYKVIGKKFLAKSIICMIVSSFMLDYLCPLLPIYDGNRMIAAVLTGVLGGVGYTAIYLRGASTGGSDFVVMAIKAFKPHINLGVIAFLSDILIILVGGVIFSDIDGIVYGMIINYLFAVIVDRAIIGFNSGKVAFIVTEYGKKVCNTIDECCMRGSTILKALGGYKGSSKEVVLVAGNNRDMYYIQKKVKDVDPESFIIIMDTREIHGEGFYIKRVADRE